MLLPLTISITVDAAVTITVTVVTVTVAVTVSGTVSRYGGAPLSRYHRICDQPPLQPCRTPSPSLQRTESDESVDQRALKPRSVDP